MMKMKGNANLPNLGLALALGLPATIFAQQVSQISQQAANSIVVQNEPGAEVPATMEAFLKQNTVTVIGDTNHEKTATFAYLSSTVFLDAAKQGNVKYIALEIPHEFQSAIDSYQRNAHDPEARKAFLDTMCKSSASNQWFPADGPSDQSNRIADLIAGAAERNMKVIASDEPNEAVPDWAAVTHEDMEKALKPYQDPSGPELSPKEFRKLHPELYEKLYGRLQNAPILTERQSAAAGKTITHNIEHELSGDKGYAGLSEGARLVVVLGSDHDEQMATALRAKNQTVGVVDIISSADTEENTLTLIHDEGDRSFDPRTLILAADTGRFVVPPAASKAHPNPKSPVIVPQR